MMGMRSQRGLGAGLGWTPKIRLLLKYAHLLVTCFSYLLILPALLVLCTYYYYSQGYDLYVPRC